MKKSAWLTHNRNQNRLALRRWRALGTRNANVGLVKIEEPAAARVIYCEACCGPVVDDAIGRKRHALKSAACEAAMREMA